MSRPLRLALAALLALPACATERPGAPSHEKTSQPMRQPTDASPLYAVKVSTIEGRETTLADWRGQAVLIVNTASECGYTPQYAGLEQLYQRYKDRGFAVLAFPSNDFGGQEPGSNADIQQFCTLRYKTTFPLFAKVQVKGEGKHPLYQQLTTTPGMEGEVRWNFGKFLVSPEGQVVARFDSKVEPLSGELTQKVESVLPH